MEKEEAQKVNTGIHMHVPALIFSQGDKFTMPGGILPIISTIFTCSSGLSGFHLQLCIDLKKDSWNRETNYYYLT